MYENYLGGPVDERRLFADPGHRDAPPTLAGFPPTIMINGEVDELRVSGEAFAASLAAPAPRSTSSTEPGTRTATSTSPARPPRGIHRSLRRIASSRSPPPSPADPPRRHAPCSTA